MEEKRTVNLVFKGKKYEKVVSTTKKEENVELSFYPQTPMKVSKKKIDRNNLLNKPKLEFVSELNLKDDLYVRARHKALLQRERMDKLNYWNQRIVEWYSVDVPLFNNLLEKLINCLSAEKKKVYARV